MIFLHNFMQNFDDSRRNAFFCPMRGRSLDVSDQLKCVIVDGNRIRKCAPDINADSNLHYMPPCFS